MDSRVVRIDLRAELQFAVEQGLATVATWDHNGDSNGGDDGGSDGDNEDHEDANEDDGEGDDKMNALMMMATIYPGTYIYEGR